MDKKARNEQTQTETPDMKKRKTPSKSLSVGGDPSGLTTRRRGEKKTAFLPETVEREKRNTSRRLK